MNEAEDRAAISFPQKTMIVCEAFAVIANLLSESFTCLVVVMEVYFDISNTQTNHLCDAIEKIAPVLFLRVKKTVLRRLLVGIRGGVGCDSRPAITPTRDSPESSVNRYTHTQGFIVVRDGHPDTLRARLERATADSLLYQGHEP